MKILKTIAMLPLVGLLSSCAPINEPNAGPDASPLSDARYLSMDPEQKYAVSSKLLSTLYKGQPVGEFFDLNFGLGGPRLKQDINHLDQIQQQLNTPVTNLASHIVSTYDKHFSTSVDNTRAIPMDLLYAIPLSKEYYNRWMAYRLTNTILFSPALELDSVANADVETVYNNLVTWLDQGMNISEIVYQHMISEENWRRFRSPEDNTREMMEIYLMRFRDDEVPLAAIACKNWFLTDSSQDFQLRKTAFLNAQPQALLERGDIVSCKDFYLALASHGSLIPAVTRRIVDAMFSEYPVSKRASISLYISRQVQPATFQEIFNAILFSEEYLLKQQRAMSYEESLFGTGNRLYWYDRAGIYQTFTDGDMVNMSQKTMTYKLGRNNETPQDSLSFAYYHKAIRDRMMLDIRTGTSTSDGGWTESLLVTNPEVAALSNTDYIHYLLLATVGRKAYDYEVTQLTHVIGSANRRNQTYIILDYASRLSEFYRMMALG